MAWAVSQAAPLRRVLVDGDLELGTGFDKKMLDGFSAGGGSGGFLGNVRILGRLNFMLQQQWLVRNSEMENTTFYNDPVRSANFVFVGTHGAPPQTDACTDAGSQPENPKPQQLVVKTAPLTIEKPYITIRPSGRYDMIIPKAKSQTAGVQWDSDVSDVHTDGFDNVFVATPNVSVRVINAKLAAGLHVVLSPGIYHLSEPIRLGYHALFQAMGKRAGSPYQVLLGLGLATLVPTQGTAAIEVEDVCGVRVAGLLLQAGPVHSDVLLRWGGRDVGGGSCESKDPGLLADVFARVGGPDTEAVSTAVMVEVNADDSVLDNLWLWRADHCEGQADSNRCPPRNCDNALIINGDRVTAYGLCAEHTQKDVVVWNGEDGASYFFQAELDSFAKMPCDNTSDYGPNVCGYRVNALAHRAWGIGVYAFFVQPGVVVPAGILVRHSATLDGFICPFKWDLNAAWWDHGESTILKAIGQLPEESQQPLTE
ncbi:unnamed protein product [Polarella glacialis]|uniref:Uncharacterized protein n=1 Tax=Polarella glacialis TaxID=89957 RepID=A0A813LE22_POLGL|nr:unnamed protein product [Polarella glacialis]